MLIGLLGARGAGKDTVAEYLAPFGFHRVALADTLKLICARDFGIDLSHFHDRRLKDRPCDALGGKTPRQVVIERADRERALDENFLVKLTWPIVERLQDEGKGVVISDVRSPVEYEHVRRNGGVLVRVWRPDKRSADGFVKGVDDHMTETALSGAPVDHMIINIEGDFGYLRRQVRTLAHHCRGADVAARSADARSAGAMGDDGSHEHESGRAFCGARS